MRETFASRDAATVVAEGRAAEYATGAIEHLAGRLAELAAELALADLVAAGVDADVAQRLAEAVQREVRSRLDPLPPIHRRPALTLVPRLKPKPTT